MEDRYARAARGALHSRLPLGQIEFVEGLETIHCDIWIEVTDLDSILEVLSKENIKLSEKVQETAWDSRFLVAEPVKGLKEVALQQEESPCTGCG